MQSTTAATTSVEPVSGKVPQDVHLRTKQLATTHGVNGLIIQRAFQYAFDLLGERKQKELVQKARLLFPDRHPRTGRGNRRVAAD